jgi:hypothetical protein
VRVTLTFSDLSSDAKDELPAHLRDDKLVVTAEADFDVTKGEAKIRHFGQRYVIADFAKFFEAVSEERRPLS